MDKAMDQNLVYAKTPNGDDAVRQSTRVVQRNLRMVLVQVDGKTSVAELGAKVGNIRLVESALRELEEGGFIAPVMRAPSVWEQGKKVAQEIKEAASQFSTFGSKSVRPDESGHSDLSAASGFSSFGKPLLLPEMPLEAPIEKLSFGRRVAVIFARKSESGGGEAISRRFRPMVLVQALLGLLLVLCVAALLYPYENFKPEIEAALGRAFQAPVRIGNVAVAVLPRPALTLRDVEIGGKGEARAEEVRVPALLALIGWGRQISAVEVSGLAMPPEGLAMLVGIGQESVGQETGFTLGQIRLQRMAILINDIALRHLQGEMLFNIDGRLDKLRLQSEDRTLRVEAVPTAQGAMLSIEGLGWRPGEGSPYLFESLQAKGLLQRGRLVLNDIDTTFMGGVLKGSWLLNWSDGMAMAAEVSLARLNARRVADAFAPALRLEGDLSGSLTLRGTGKDWQSMWANVDASLEAEIVRGVLSGVDLGEAARRGGRQSMRGGATKFDRLRGEIIIDPQRVTGRDIRLEAGLISAHGRFVADHERKVEGLFDVSISSSVSGIRMPIKVSGTLPDLVAAAGR